MRLIPVSELDSLSKELEIFTQQKPVAGLLLRAGIYPPLPVTRTHIIYGFSFIKAAKKIGLSSLNTVELDIQDMPGMLEISLSCENRPGAYSWIEKERMFRLIGRTNQIDEISAFIEGKPDPGFTEKIETFISFPAALKRLVDKNYLDFKSAGTIRDLPEEVFAVIEQLKNDKKMTSSEVRIFLISLFEISKRDSLSHAQIISLCREALPGDGAAPGRDGARGTRAQGVNPVAAIHRLRYPKLTELEDRFGEIEEKLIKGSGISLTPPPFFEGSSYSIQFNFQSKKQLEKRIGVLVKLAEESDELFKLL